MRSQANMAGSFLHRYMDRVLTAMPMEATRLVCHVNTSLKAAAFEAADWTVTQHQS